MPRKPPPPPRRPPRKAGNGHAPGLGDRVQSLGRAARSFRAQARSTAEDFSHALDVRRRVRRHPYLMVAAAMGVGYVLGGGLFSKTTVRLLGVAGRVAALPFVRSELVGLAEAVLSGHAEAEDGQSAQDVTSPS
jgi:hypothetical protein